MTRSPPETWAASANKWVGFVPWLGTDARLTITDLGAVRVNRLLPQLPLAVCGTGALSDRFC